MSNKWESTMLLRVAEQAYIRAEHPSSGRQTQDLVECPSCRRTADWLIAAAADGAEDGVEFVCRCGREWQLTVDLGSVVGLAEFQPTEPQWTCLDDARQDLGFNRRPGGTGGGSPRRPPRRRARTRR